MHRYLLIFTALSAILFAGCSASAKLERHVKRADAFYKKGAYEEARIEYLNAYQLDRNNPHIALRLGESFLKNGEILRAFQLLSHAVTLQPTNNEARVKLGSVLLLGGQLDKAREQASEVLKNVPLDPDALLILANASIGTNEIAEARARFNSLVKSHPANPVIHLGLGSIAQRSGEYPLAENSFKRAVELDPKSARNHLALGGFYFLRNDTNKSEVHLKTAMDLSPLKSVERLGFAEFQIKSGRAEAAEKTLTEATEKHPDFTSAWNMLTQIAFSQNDTNKAAAYISKAIAKSPRDRDAQLNLSRLKLASRDYKSAAAELQRLSNDHPRDSQVHFQLAVAQLAADDPNQAFVSINKAIAANTNYVDAYLLRARLQLARSDWNNAIPDLKTLIARFPNAASAYYLLASAHRARGNLDDAASVYTAITKTFPKDAQGFHLLGVTLRQQKKVSDARKAFEEALKIQNDFLAPIESLTDLDLEEQKFDAAKGRIEFYLEKYPKSPLPPLLLGKILIAQNKPADAEAAILKAISFDPEFMPAHRALAEFYRFTKQTDKAIAKLESIVAKDQKDIGTLIQLGMLYDINADYPRALDRYEVVLKINPNSMPALNNMAYILSERMNEVDRGLQYARRVRDLAPVDPFAADTFGWILWKKGQYPEALAALQQSAERLGDQPEVQYHLGMAQYMMGDIPAATAALTKAARSTNEFVGKDLAANALSILQIDPASASPATAALLQQHVNKNPRDVFAIVQLARFYEAKADLNKARETYERGLSTQPKSSLLLSGLASLYAGALNEPSRAMDYARQAWALSATPATAAILGPIAYQAGDFKWASGRLIEAARVNSSSELLFYKGLASYALGYVSQAREELGRVAQSGSLDKDRTALAKAAVDLLQFHLSPASPDAAQSAIVAARKIDPNFPPASVASGLIAEAKQDYQAARFAYEAALQYRPNLLIAQRQLAILLGEKLADDAKAQQLATALRQDFPDDTALARVLGKIAYRRGDYREAVRLLNTAVSRQPNDSDLLYHLGMAQYHLKDKSAKASLTKAVGLEPNAALTAHAKKALAELK